MFPERRLIVALGKFAMSGLRLPRAHLALTYQSCYLLRARIGVGLHDAVLCSSAGLISEYLLSSLGGWRTKDEDDHVWAALRRGGFVIVIGVALQRNRGTRPLAVCQR